MKEKRRFTRFSVDILGINGKMLFANDVEILDLSPGGISLRVDRRLNIGSEYSIKMGSNDRTLSLKGTVIWSKITGAKKGGKDDVIPIYTAGIKFSGVEGDNATALLRFIEHATHHTYEEAACLSGLRVSMRFPAYEENRAVIDVPQNYLVRELSLSGMLVQSEFPLPADDRLPMEISLPGGHSVRFIGRVASCSEVEGAGTARYALGIEFFEMPEDDMVALKEFVFLLARTD